MRSLWRPAYVAIGSNLDSPRERVLEAMERMSTLNATRTVLRSRLYLTRPMGPQDQPNFVNAAVALLTQLAPQELLSGLLDIERSMGRDRQQRWGPRIIDLDLLWMIDSPVSEPGLTVPHPGVSTRNFVLYPLADIAPTIKIPKVGNVLDLKRDAGGDGISVLE
ncbi:MAG: 2-amino-4-hydroxy-6-hydroxymethyldihydropteridine diphosphokinase [Gammaproteobacteria bacterium]|jgi:2-amino-4-hydroxy-6-hydroxymethyldihydropteridine diphosphokinase|nr:2-amino-4-hydroxy-6-hydroxymethyldihydropteridine diphosphokinase [Gammaproteobacteria bacterium]MEA3138402.1 2-amino-4-hydroxy-6-hydroxymethyldihydropteridine diphosphokinase [Gammaproteobacteria bacterium]